MVFCDGRCDFFRKYGADPEKERIKGTYFHCTECPGVDLCTTCHMHYVSAAQKFKLAADSKDADAAKQLTDEAKADWWSFQNLRSCCHPRDNHTFVVKTAAASNAD
jgi:hypothetical protein